MNPVALILAAIGAVLLTRRKTLKDDAERVKSGASESVRRLNDRVRDRSGDVTPEEQDAATAVVDLTDEVETSTEDVVTSADDTEIEKVTTTDAD